MTIRQGHCLIIDIIKEINKLENPDQITFIHGDCVGSDDELHFLISRDVTFRTFIRIRKIKVKTEIYPSNIPNQRAFNKADKIHEPGPPLERNKDIVRFANVVFATPRGMVEEKRSGTWSTIRHVRYLVRMGSNQKLRIVYPDGSIGE